MVRCVYGSKKLVFPLFPMPCVFCNPAQNRLGACMFPKSLFALFYHLSSESLIYPTASFNRLKSKDDAVFYPVLLFIYFFCILFFFPKEIMSTSVILAHSSTQERLQILSNNLCLSTTCCQEQKEQSNVPDDYSLAEVLVHLLQSNLYS